MKDYILKYLGGATLALSPVYGSLFVALTDSQLEMAVAISFITGCCGLVLLLFHFGNGGK